MYYTSRAISLLKKIFVFFSWPPPRETRSASHHGDPISTPLPPQSTSRALPVAGRRASCRPRPLEYPPHWRIRGAGHGTGRESRRRRERADTRSLCRWRAAAQTRRRAITSSRNPRPPLPPLRKSTAMLFRGTYALFLRFKDTKCEVYPSPSPEHATCLPRTCL